MIARRTVLSLSLALALVPAGLSALAAAAQAQTLDVHERNYDDLTDEMVKTQIRLFTGIPTDVPTALAEVRDREGKPLTNQAKERYLKPDHPAVQPRPSDSEWRRYLGVPNESLIATQVRPEENPREPFQTLPKVKVPGKISVTYVHTPEGIFPKADPFGSPPGTNLLPTVYRNSLDGLNNEMENTLPSTRTNPYNLHDGDPVVTAINPRSPTDDLEAVLDKVYEILTGQSVRGLWEKLDRETLEQIVAKQTPETHMRKLKENADLLRVYLKMGRAIITGEPISDRAYSGFPLLHHSGHKRITRVIPVLGKDGKVVGGNADVHQIWYDGRIESDTMFLDFKGDNGDSDKLPEIPDTVPWTITYTIDVLERGSDDFATTTMFFDDPAAEKIYAQNQSATPEGLATLKHHMEFQYRTSPGPGPVTPPRSAPAVGPGRLPNVAMDQTFFPMDTGTRTVFKIKMPPYKYLNLIYTWGWRLHPPRAQGTENAQKSLSTKDHPEGIPIVDFERTVFTSADPGFDPVFKLGDLAPAKRILRAFDLTLCAIETALNKGVDAQKAKATARACVTLILDSRNAFLDWKDRTHLPSGLRPDPESDLTVLFVNNTIYGELNGGGWNDFPPWRTRGTPLKITLINCDYFDHGYLNVDFGGNRGWESLFKSALRVGGTGTFFSFGRFHYRFNTMPGSIGVPAAKAYKGRRPVQNGELPDSVEPGVHRLWIDLNHDPSRRLRFYQFDPTHHDVAIFSVH